RRSALEYCPRVRISSASNSTGSSSFVNTCSQARVRGMDDLTLTGRVAVVTGGSRGIGRAIAITLARWGAAVALCYRERQEAADETGSLVREQRVNVFVGQCDVSNEASVV